VDGTVGGGGHAEAILEKMQGQGIYIAMDRDSQALQEAKEKLKKFGNQVFFVQGVFSEIPEILETLSVKEVDGILIDLGVSSFQIDEAERGFSFLREGPLDMRMNPESEDQTAADLVNHLPEKKLEEIFQKFGEERFARRIARAIVAIRRAEPFLTTQDLSDLIEKVVPPPFKKARARIHPATRVFQALRIVVNQELEHLTRFLNLRLDFLKEGGRIGIISFHSLEDRCVKQIFRQRQDFKVITKRPVQASPDEIQMNVRSRSAKFRVAERKVFL